MRCTANRSNGEPCRGRAIAAATGDSKDTVARELRAVANETPEREGCDDCHRPADKCICSKPNDPLKLICDDCGNKFSVEVWHCPDCDHHWSPEDDECKNCRSFTADPPTVTGTDGKTYPAAPKNPPAKPQRRPLPDSFFDAFHDLNKQVARVHRLTEDDRFPRNVDQVATRHRSDLISAVETLSEVLDRMS